MKIGFIGAGNMGTALIKTIAGSGMIKPENIFIYDIDTVKASQLAEQLGVTLAGGNSEVAANSDIIILAVKPAYIKSALEGCKAEFTSSKVLVSIAVGVPIKLYKSILGEDAKVIRTMPNTPAMVGEGMTLVACDKNVTAEEKKLVMKLLECVGKVDELDEKLMSEVTALTGSSPAYVFMFIEAMADAAVLSGIPRALSYKLAAQAVLGSAKMVLETGLHPGELKDMVCSPAGTTIEAVRVLENAGFRSAVIEAMGECTNRAREIGRALAGE
jgi:pyrroline-5-carboxylate reductase